MGDETPLLGQESCEPCGRILSPRWAYCPSCGAEQDAEEAVTDGGKEDVKTMCPECRVVRWHDRDPEDGAATCRGCGHESTPGERHAIRNEERLDDLTPALKDGTGAEDANADLTRWSR